MQPLVSKRFFFSGSSEFFFFPLLLERHAIDLQL